MKLHLNLLQRSSLTVTRAIKFPVLTASDDCLLNRVQREEV